MLFRNFIASLVMSALFILCGVYNDDKGNKWTSSWGQVQRLLKTWGTLSLVCCAVIQALSYLFNQEEPQIQAIKKDDQMEVSSSQKVFVNPKSLIQQKQQQTSGTPPPPESYPVPPQNDVGNKQTCPICEYPHRSSEIPHARRLAA